MAPPSNTLCTELTSIHEPCFGSTLLVPSTTTPPPSMGVAAEELDNRVKDAKVVTTFDATTCGWYSDFVSHAFDCNTFGPSLTCATNTENVVACTKKGDKSTFPSSCVDMVNATKEDCDVPGILCCNSIDPSCMTMLWTASPSRSLVGCNGIHSTWTMLDHPSELEDATSSGAGGDLTSNSLELASSGSTHMSSSLSSSTDASPTDTSRGTTSSLSFDSGTSSLAASSGFSIRDLTTITTSSSTTLLPLNSTPPTSDKTSGNLSTGAAAGIGVGSSIGLLLILVAVTVYLFKRYQGHDSAKPEQPEDGTGGALQDNPSGDLPAAIAPPARNTPRSLWDGGHHLSEGASEVPVEMRGRMGGAAELPGSPVEMAALRQREYNAYRAQAAQYRRASLVARERPTSYRRSPSREDGAWGAYTSSSP